MAVAMVCPECSSVDVPAASHRLLVGGTGLHEGSVETRSDQRSDLQEALKCRKELAELFAWAGVGGGDRERGGGGGAGTGAESNVSAAPPAASTSSAAAAEGLADAREAKPACPSPRRLPSPVPPRASGTRLMRPRAFSSGSGPVKFKAANGQPGHPASPPSPLVDAFPVSPKCTPATSKAAVTVEECAVAAEVKAAFSNPTTNSSTRMNRLDSFRMRLRKGVSESCHRRGPMVARHPGPPPAVMGDAASAPVPAGPLAPAPSPSPGPAPAPPPPPSPSLGAAPMAPPRVTPATPPPDCTCEGGAHAHDTTPAPAGDAPRSPSPVLSMSRSSSSLCKATSGAEGNHSRKRSPSLSRSRPSSPGNGSNRRPPSPSALDPAVLEGVKRRVRRVQKVRLYLLQQPGPNSFLVGGDSPEHKYKVVIGPQTCSCGRGPFCLHLLFVMLRVFQVPENDSKLYTKELKNYEVESLFQHYQQRRNSRVHGMPEENQKVCSSSKNLHQSPIVPDDRGQNGLDSPPIIENKSAEEELCPICLLEMVDGESLVVCTTGCRNKLHLHCMAVWAVECNHQGENVLCPLCRQPWQDETATLKSVPGILPLDNNFSKKIPGMPSPSKEHSSVQLPWETSGSMCFQHLPGPGPGPGPLYSPTSQKVGGLKAPTSPHQQKPVKRPQYLPLNKLDYHQECPVEDWKQNSSPSNNPADDINRSWQFSAKTCTLQPDLPHSRAGPIPLEHTMMASEWIKVFGMELVMCLYSRDWKDREMAMRGLVNYIITAHQKDDKEKQQRVVWCCAKILAMVVGDPVFKVYLGCIRCLRILIRCVESRNVGHLEEFRSLLKPIIKGLLRKCADRNHRTSHLSAEVLVEIAKDQNGETAGSNSCTDMAVWGINGLELVLGCVLEHFSLESVNWQWLAGRLLMLSTLLHIFPDEFCLKYVPLYANESGYKLNNFNRLFSVIEFSYKALQSSHSTVSKLARHVFVLSSSMTTAEKGMLNQIVDMISELDSGLQTRLKKRLQVAIERQMQNQCLPKKSKICYNSQEANTSPTAQNKIDLPVNSPHVYSKGPLQSLPVRPKDLPLGPAYKNKKVLKCHQLSNSHPFSTPSTKRWINSSSKLSNLFSRNKKTVELLPTSKPESPENCGLDCGHGTVESLSSPENCSCQTPGDEDNISFFTRVMGCISNSPCDKLVNEKFEVTPSSELPEDSSQQVCQSSPTTVPVPDVMNVETLVRPIRDSMENKNMEGVFKIKSYIEDFHWKRGPLLGTGAYSVCYQAWDVETGTLMAVKQVPYCRNSEEEQEGVETGIRKEIMTMSKLRHPNVLTILGATREGNHFNIFVEWMAGGSVASLLESYGPFNQCVIIEYIKQVLEGLSYLHENHILHRDLKGANLLVDSSGKQLRIGDFGAAACLESHGTVPGEFQGQLLGTIAFMAPEVLRGENYGRSCDIWSVGCCMIEMATTKAPWKENQMSNHLALMYRIASSKDPPFIPDSLGPASKDLALQCLQVNSDLRPTAKELLNHHCFKPSHLQLKQAIT